MVQLVLMTMNAAVVFAKVEAVALIMVLLAIQLRIAADILHKAAPMGPVRNKKIGKIV